MLNLSKDERPRLTLKPGVAVVKIIDDDGMFKDPMYLFYKSVLTPEAAIGFLNTNLTIFEGGEVNFTIGVLQGYLDTTVTILFTTEVSSAKGSYKPLVIMVYMAQCIKSYIHF